MLHACFTPFASCFVYTSWRFYAISETNLLTRCHSAISCFLLFLCFRKATQEKFLKLDEEDQNSYFSRTKDENRKRAGGGPEGRLTMRGRGQEGGEAPLVAL
jgi:hypothetical protein